MSLYIQYLLINYINIFIYKILIDKIYTITLFVNNIKTFIKNIIRICLIKVFNEIIHSDISTIEKNGGGSARCMIAEIFLTPK